MPKLGIATLGVILGLAAMSLPSDAKAQYACAGPRPGQTVVGMTQGGPGLAPVALCADDPSYYAPQQASPPPPDPSDVLAGFAQMRIQQIRQMQALANDPEFIKIRDGYWSYFYDDRAPNSGLGCIAMFQSLKGIVQLTGPGRIYPGGTLVLIGPDIPKPAKLSVVLATLDQKIVPPQTVHAYNYSMADGGLGALAFTVPSMDAVLNGMKDDLTFKVTLDGAQVIDAFYRQGLKARETLKKCLAGHPPV